MGSKLWTSNEPSAWAKNAAKTNALVSGLRLGLRVYRVDDHVGGQESRKERTPTYISPFQRSDFLASTNALVLSRRRQEALRILINYNNRDDIHSS